MGEGGENVAVVGRNGGVGYAEEVGLHEAFEAGDGSGVVRGGERGGGGRGGESGIVLGGGEGGRSGKCWRGRRRERGVSEGFRSEGEEAENLSVV